MVRKSQNLVNVVCEQLLISKRAIVDLLPSPILFQWFIWSLFGGCTYLTPQNDVVYGWPQGLKRENIYKMNGNKFGTIRKWALKNINSIVLYQKTDLKNGKIRHNLVRWYPYRISYREVGNRGTKRAHSNFDRSINLISTRRDTSHCYFAFQFF